MRSERAFVGARGVDSYPFSAGGSAQQALALKKSGIDFFVGYPGVMTKPRLNAVLDAGLAFMPVTLAAKYDGAAAVAQCKVLGLPSGVTGWLDLEGKALFETDRLLARADRRRASCHSSRCRVHCESTS